MSKSMPHIEFWVLTALAGGRRHGYEILRETEASSDGAVSLKVATLYAALERLQKAGLIDGDGEEVVNGRARRYFRLSESGEQQLRAEVQRLERSARVARARLATTMVAFPLPRLRTV